ncbi:lysophospholipid acyltransferase 1-like [Physella acuta]|uniref:lysophospholipid acyltransferase 1-like n=1 Tax=Physella acuta TaxID=109671 RepID=UPI0027DB47C3|nr:lysophospholipid acyltransferase 1-like [Physella acuta]
MATVSPLYQGSRLFLSASGKTGISLDQFNFVVAQFTALLFGFLLRYWLPHSAGKPQWRSVYCLVTGLALLWFVIGWSLWVVLVQVTVCYTMMKFFHHKFMPLVVFFFALGYMLVMYVLRNQQNFDDLCYDATYPLMITTQKVTTLAFSIGDWKALQKGKKMQEERVKWAVSEVPSVLEFLAFMLSFQGILAGPFCHYSMFRAFIEGNTKERLEKSKNAVEYLDDPSSVMQAVVTKILAVFLWIFVTACVKPHFPDYTNVDPEFIANNNFVVRLGYLYISLFLHRSKYYVSWILADAVYNSSGLGYAGKDEKGKPRWTAMSNVFVWKIETATSLKVYLDNWNILTTHWLRHVCYMRAPFLNTLLTFVLSALWHGLFIGYYITFVSAAFFVEAGRKIRQNIRPLFQTSKASRFVYEVLTFLGTQFGLSFLVLSFVILHWEPSIRFHSSFYWFYHVMVGLVLITLPSRKSSRPEPATSTVDNNHEKLPQEPSKEKLAQEPSKEKSPQEPSKEAEDGIGDGERPRKRDVMFVQKS